MEQLTYLEVLVRISSEHPHHDRVVDYCFELSSLHADFFWMLEWFERSYDLTDMDPPESGLGLIRKKFLITRTEDDFSFRLYAYQEKVYQLINLVCNIGLNERDPKQRENILNWLENNEPQLREELRFFKDNMVVRERGRLGVRSTQLTLGEALRSLFGVTALVNGTRLKDSPANTGLYSPAYLDPRWRRDLLDKSW